MPFAVVVASALVSLSLALPAAALAAETPVTGSLPAPVSTSSAIEATEPPAEPVVTPEPPAPLTMSEAIAKGRAMLQAAVAERNAARKSPTYPVANRNSANVTLAVWDRDDDTFALVDFRKSGDELVHTGGPALPVRVSLSAKINSVYVLPPETNALVVGVIYPNVINVGTTRAPKWAASETVVTPYQSVFYTPEMLSAGSDYLSFLIQDAYDELDAKGIMSRAFPDKPLTEIVDPYLVKSIAIIEHSGVYDLTKPDDQDKAIGRFLVRLAINGESAFGGAISTAGAAGMVQFIPSTYKLMVDRRPDLALIPDFRTGMANHQNAVKAQVAYLDMDLANMAMAKTAYVTDKSKAAEFLAASYNGGQTRVRRAFNAYGSNWSQAATDLRALAVQLNGKQAAPLAVIKANSLRAETVGYVAKLKRTYNMLTAGYYATPKAPSGALPVLELPPASVPVASAATPGTICFGDGGCVQ